MTQHTLTKNKLLCISIKYKNYTSKLMNQNNFKDLVSKLITDLETDSHKLSTLLVRAKSIAKKVNHKELETFIKTELEGTFNDDLPDYRKRNGTPMGVFQNSYTGQIDNVPLNMENLIKSLECEPDFFYQLDLRYSVPEIEDYLQKSKIDELIIKFTPNQLSILQQFATKSGNWFMKDGFYKLSLSTFPVIISHVKSKLHDHLLEIAEGLESPDNNIKLNINHQVFLKGKPFDALTAFLNIIQKAKNEIILIDNYVNDKTINLFSDIPDKIIVKIVTQPKSLTPTFITVLESFKKQYRDIIIKQSIEFHDRFLIIDNTDYYSIGASIKDAGNKIFMLTKINDPRIQNLIIGQIEQ